MAFNPAWLLLFIAPFFNREIAMFTIKWWGYIFQFWRADFIDAIKGLLARTHQGGRSQMVAGTEIQGLILASAIRRILAGWFYPKCPGTSWGAGASSHDGRISG